MDAGQGSQRVCLWTSTGAASSAAEGEGWKPGEGLI